MNVVQKVINSREIESLQAIIDKIPISVLIMNTQGAIIDCNTHALTLFGTGRREDIIGKTQSALSPRMQQNGVDSRGEWLKRIEQAGMGGDVSFTFGCQTLTGRLFTANVTITKISYEEQECLLCSVMQITDAERTEVITALIEKNPYSLLELNPDLTITDVNPTFLKVSGYSREEWIGRRFADLKIVKREGTSITESVRTKEVAEGRAILDLPTGNRHLDYSHIPVIDAEGKLVKIYTIMADRTDLVKKTQESDTLIRENPASIVSLDIRGNILAVNPAFINITHVSEERLLKMGMHDFKNLKREGMSATDAVASRKPAKGQMVVDFGWAVKTLDYVYLPVFDVNDNVTGLMAMYVDVSEAISHLAEMETFIHENPHAVMTLSPEMKVLDVNPAFCTISGYTREQAVLMDHKQFKSTKREGATAEDAIRNKKAMGGKIICLFPGGARYLEYTYLPIFDPAGNVTKVFDIFADITQLVEKINESEALIRENPASIVSMDPSGRLTSVNPSFIEITHNSEGELLKKGMHDFNIIKREGASLTDVVSSKKPAKGRMVIDFIWAVKILDFSYIPVLNVNNEVIGLIAMYLDVTEQVSSEEENQALIQDNPHAILTMDSDLRIIDSNPAFFKITGYSKSDIAHLKLSDFRVTERDGQSTTDAAQTKRAVNGRIKVTFPSGNKNLDYVYIPIMDKKGNVVKFIEIFSDMTAIRSMVDYLKESVENVQKYIGLLAKGNTQFTINALDADEYSASAKEQFVIIGEAIDTARKAIGQLVQTANEQAKAVLAGNIGYRSDPTIHEGDYRAIIEGINRIMDSVDIPVRESVRVSREYANYNFVERFDPKIEVNGDWKKFKAALDSIGLQVSDAISLINKSVADLASSAEEANASVEEVLSGSHQITESTTKVSQNANEGDEGTKQVLKAMEDLNETVGAVSRKAESVSVSSNEANTFAKEGINLAKKSDTAMNEITRSTTEVESIVSDINAQMDEIGKIVRLISDIASQTNLLALNAAIEAARAGEAGRGFAVVAAEVKSLAQDSRKSAEDIADMIAALQNKANQAKNAMDKSTSSVKDGSQSLEQTLKSFNQIAVTIENINQNIVEVASASEEQAASVEEVTASIQEVSNLIQNTSKEAADAAAATEEANASIDEIGRIMNGVVTVVDTVTKEISKFKVA